MTKKLLFVDIQADETPAVDVVLKADKKRLELLAEVKECCRSGNRHCNIFSFSDVL